MGTQFPLSSKIYEALSKATFAPAAAEAVACLSGDDRLRNGPGDRLLGRLLREKSRRFSAAAHRAGDGGERDQRGDGNRDHRSIGLAAKCRGASSGGSVRREGD